MEQEQSEAKELAAPRQRECERARSRPEAGGRERLEARFSFFSISPIPHCRFACRIDVLSPGSGSPPRRAMGCGASTETAKAEVREARPKAGRRQSLKQAEKLAAARLTKTSEDTYRAMFSEYRVRHSQLGAESPRQQHSSEKTINEAGLRKLLGSAVDEALFSFLFRLFDVDGSVSARS